MTTATRDKLAAEHVLSLLAERDALKAENERLRGSDALAWAAATTLITRAENAEDERDEQRKRAEIAEQLNDEWEPQVIDLRARCERMEGLIRRRFPGLMTAMMEWQLDQDMLALLTELDAAKEPNRE